MKIANKLWLTTALTVVSLTVLAGTAHQSSSNSNTVRELLSEKTENLLMISGINDDVQDVLLASMDIIVDKAAGKPDEELVKEIEDSYIDIQRHVAELIKQDEQKIHSGQYQQALELSKVMYDAATKGLFPAVTARASEAEFARLDDLIDGTGGELVELLSTIKTQINTEFEQVSTNAHTQMQDAQRLNWIVYGLSALATLALISLIIVSIRRAISTLSDSIQSISEGNTNITIAGAGNDDEIGVMARALEKLRDQVSEAFRLKQMVDDMPLNIMTADPHNDFKITYANKASRATLAQLHRHVPEGAQDVVGRSIDIFHKDPARIRTMLADPRNLPHQSKIQLGDEVLDMKVSAMHDTHDKYIGAMLSWSVVTHISHLADTFETSVGSVSNQIAGSANSLNEGAVSLQGAIEELSATASEISKRVHDSLVVVRDAAAKGEAAQQTMETLVAASGKVTNVVGLIQKIAEKTNLLALNATIESARAGEAGKGFAVVANEVKLLANQTAGAITDINQQVTEMQHSAANAVTMVKEMSSIIQSVSQFATDVATSVEEQQASTSEIARNICGTGTRNIGNYSDASVISLAAQLSSVSSELKKECTAFLQKIRSM
jgi:methyl-accepting chemotaxis protein